MLWCTKDLSSREKKSLRVNIEYDHATLIRWSPDGKAFLIHKAMANTIEVYKVSKKPDGFLASATKALEFPRLHIEDVVGMDIACTGRYIITCSKVNDLVVWDLKGQILATVDTVLGSTHRVRVSPCGRFVAASGFTPDVKVWEVVFSKSDDFKQIGKAFNLAGHSSGVLDFGFSADTSHMVTVSKDGTFRFHNTKSIPETTVTMEIRNSRLPQLQLLVIVMIIKILNYAWAFNANVEFEKGEDPHLLTSGTWDVATPAGLALSPNGEVLVISHGSSLSFYSTITGKLDTTIEDLFAGPVQCLAFDAVGEYVLAAGDRHIKIFRNITGYRTSIESSKRKLEQRQTSATKERLEKNISDSKSFLRKMNEKCE